jgi:hypothetical protein
LRRVKWLERARESLRTQVRRHPALVGAFALLWICALVPIWWPRFLPLLDLPEHLAAIAVWHRYGDAAWNYSRFYDLNLLPVPYWGYFYPVHLLAYVMSIEAASKVYLSAYALALPVGVALVARRIGRSPWLALFAFPLVFNFNLSLGFVTFCGGLALYFYAVYALDVFMETPTRRAAAAVGLLALALYFTHILPWMFYGVSAAVLIVTHGWRPRRMAAAVALLAPSLAAAIHGFRAARGTTAVAGGALRFDAHFDTVLSNLQTLPSSILATWSGDRAFQIMLLLAALWMMLLLSARADERDSAAAGRFGFAYRLEIIFALAALMPFVLPGHMFKPVDLWMIAGRFVSVAALWAILLPHGPIAGRRAWLVAAVAALAVYYPLKLAGAWKRFDGRAQQMARMMSHVPRGSSTLMLVVGDAADPDIDKQAQPYTQFHAYPQLLAGGFDPWFLSTGFPIVAKPDAALPAPIWKHPETFRLDVHGVRYDYVLTKSEVSDYSLLGPNEANTAPIVDAIGEWRLYRIKHP